MRLASPRLKGLFGLQEGPLAEEHTNAQRQMKLDGVVGHSHSGVVQAQPWLKEGNGYPLPENVMWVVQALPLVQSDKKRRPEPESVFTLQQGGTSPPSGSAWNKAP